MRSGRYRIFILSILFIAFQANFTFGGVTGKVSGKVTDKNTGEPLPGVNVIVSGTTLGAATDFEGRYTILNIPPGSYKLTASLIGYSPVNINNVRVHIDQTTPLDIELSEEAIEIGNVTVVAERNQLKKDVSTSVAAMQPDEIETLPVSSVTEVVGLQAGVEEGLVIRGGSADQVLIQLDGVTLRDPRDNTPISSVALSSIQEVSIERGGFNAEYGQVRSGIINIVAREGDVNNYYGSFQMKYSPPTQKNFGMSVYDPNSMWNKPYLDDAVAWTGTKNGAWSKWEQLQYPVFEGWNSISKALLSDDDPTNDLSPAAAQKVWMWERRRRPAIEPDYNFDGSFGGPVPYISKMLGNLRFFTSFRMEREMLLIPLSRDDYREYTWSGKVNSDLTQSMKLVLTASRGKTYNVAMNTSDNQFNNPSWGINGVQFWNPTDYLRSPFEIAEITAEQRPSKIFTPSWYSQAEVNHFTLSGKLTDFITQSTFYEASFEHVYRWYQTGPVAARNTSKIYEPVPGYFVDEAPYGYDPNPYTGFTGMFYGGHSAQMRDSSKVRSYAAKFDLTSQINQENLVKVGIELSYFDLNLDYGKVSPFFKDINYVKEQWKPYRLSAYVQDKIEMLGFIANIGVRMDMSNPNTEWIEVNDFDKYYNKYNPESDYPKKKAEVDIAFSPRLGISHPITENSKLYFNYGHFKQMPAYQEMFRLGRSVTGSALSIGDPSLVQAKTVSYELGYDHVLFDQYLLQVAAFYNDITNQQTYTQYISDKKAIGYFRATNNSYADIRGLEMTFKKTEGDWIRGFATFTYQVTTNGAFGKPIIDENPGQQSILDQTTSNLYQRKPVPQPRSRASITFLTPSEYGPEFAGIQPLSDWSLNVLADWRSGEYLTYNPKNLINVLNNIQVTDYYNIDVRLNKSFDFNFLDVMLFMEVRNLFNLKRLSGASFWDNHDQRYYLESLHLPQSNAYDNIPGDDRVGDYRKEGVDYQPVMSLGSTANAGEDGVIYWIKDSRKYMEYKNGNWSEVESGRMDKILEDKAYIDMPNNSSFDFLNPRQIFFGINLSFKL